jgi:amino acid adenylation domain-containing protein/non-ribosomal peptide synthase protein (TIGR01720 family)
MNSSETLSQRSGLEIAIIGMAGRFPGASNLDEYWENLQNGVESIAFFSDEELLASGGDATLVRDPHYVKARGILEDIESVDAGFFGYTIREAALMDPQHRLFLECAWEALENAGYNPEIYNGLISVFSGTSINSYLLHNLYSHTDLMKASGPLQLAISSDKDHLATRTAYKFNLKGMGVTVQTACSTSLVAVHLACQSLLHGECDIALAGGVSVAVPQKSGYLYQEGGIVSPDGHCRTFDARAQGTVGGCGGGVVVLKRLDEAIADKDHIYALIKGSATNNDGSLKVGYTAPSVDGQTRVIKAAQQMAEVEAETITYIEAHGTGTPLGDPIEVAALTQAFRSSTEKKSFCAIGSVKTNIGHLDAAAGIAGLIKTVLALKHRLIPPSLNFERPNPQIAFEESPFYVNTALSRWEVVDIPRRAGVSAFGVGGTNAHVILEEAPAPEPVTPSRPWQLLLLSARTATALKTSAANLAGYLKRSSALNLADVAYTLQTGRKPFTHRLMLLCRDIHGAVDVLERMDAEQVLTAVAPAEKRSVAFLFPGQGSQYIHMASDLYQVEPIFREQVDLCSNILDLYLGMDLRKVLYPEAEPTPEAIERLNQTEIAQPALFVIEYALARLWMSLGVQPEAMIGHSVGEYVAACLAGVFSLEDALKLIAARGRLMQQLPRGKMLAVSLPQEEIIPLLGEQLSLAAVNGPSRCIVSGPIEAIDALERLLGEQSVVCRQLHTSHAFHSAMMEPALAPFTELVKQVPLSPPAIPFISNLTGRPITAGEATDPGYWARHMRQTVRFADGMRTLLAEDPSRVLLEVGPGHALSAMVTQHPQASREQIILSSLRHPQIQCSDDAFLLQALGRLWLAGVSIDWPGFYARERRQRLPLPTYPFERQRCWIDPPQKGIQGSNGTRLQDILPGIPANVTALPQNGRENGHALTKDTQERGMVMVETRPVALSPSSRRENISSTLKTIFAQLFGVNPADIEDSTTFFEMGADSLALLQASQAIREKLAISVPFRLLFEEYPTIEALAGYIDRELPPEALRDAASTPAASTLPPAPLMQTDMPQQTPVPENRPEGMPGTLLERVVTQQLQIMSQQLELLRGSGARPAVEQQALLSAQESVQAFPHRPEVPSTRQSGEAEKDLPMPAKQANSSILSLQIDPETYVPYRPAQKSINRELSPKQQEHIEELITDLSRRTAKSKELAQTYRPVLADNRASAGFSPLLKELLYPLVVERAAGSRVWDVDGNEYVDVSMGFGALLFGHSPRFMVEALEAQVKRGFQLGLQSNLAGKVAQLICELTGTERVTFCNSGTEAVMTALRLARAVTGRSKIALFTGSYHGTFDGVLVRAQKRGDGAPKAIPLAPGVSPRIVEDVLLLDFDTPQSLSLLKAHAHELAAVLVELPQSRRPDLQPIAFLRDLRQLTQEAGIALIFDEVVAGFRTHPGGAQALFGIRADLVTYGKAAGGGLPVGIVAGKASYMDAIDGGQWSYGDQSYPQSLQTFFAGTYFKHPFLVAGIWAALNHIKESGPALQQRLNQRTTQLGEALNAYFEQAQVPIRMVHFSSLFRFVMPPEFKQIEANLFFYHLLARGVYIWEGRNCYLSTAHTDEDLEHIIRAVKESIEAMRQGGFLGGSAPLPDPSKKVGAWSQEISVVSAAGPVPLADVPRDQEGDHADAIAIPLTEAQKEIWVLTQMDEAVSRAYNETVVLRMDGALNLEALQEALQEVVHRHEALRTTFSPQGDFQYVAATAAVDISVEKLADGSPDERQARIAAWLSKAGQEAFDLVHGPLMRARILQLEEQQHLLLLSFHHLIADGWSIGVIVRELSICYAAALQGNDGQLSPPMPYRRYVEWLAKPQQSTKMDEAEIYWLEQFSDSFPLLDLPADRPRRANRNYTGARQQVTIDATLYKDLKRWSARHKSTLFTTLLTGYMALLHRLSEQWDIVVGIPVAGQTSVEGETLVGHCVNFLPLRSQVTADTPFPEHLATVKKILLAAHKYQLYPFSRLIKKLNPPRDPGRPLPVTAAFNLDRSARPRFSDLAVDIVAAPVSSAKFDFYVNITEMDDELHLACEYATDLFDDETIGRWMAHFQCLLRAVVAHSDLAISDLPLLTEDEQQQVLVEWNKTETDYPQHQCIHELFTMQVRRTPDAVAAVSEEQQLTYQELDKRANQLAQYLRSLGIGLEATVGICVERSLPMVVGLLGILKAGAAYVPLDPTYPPDRLAFMLEDARVPVLLTQNHLLSCLPTSGQQIVCLDTDWPTIARQQADMLYNSPGQMSVDNLAYIIYTSGSTGKPKGVSVTHRGVNRLLFNTNYIQIQPTDRIAQASTSTFDAATFEIWGALLHGAQLVSMTRDVMLSPHDFAAQLREQSISTLFLTTTLFNQLAREDPQIYRELHHLLVGGEQLDPRWVRAVLKNGPPRRLLNAYGPTESVTFSCWYLISDVPEEATSIPIGHPISHTQIYLLDPRLHPVPIGVTGEIYIGGDGLARGYLNRPELTAERFIPNPFSTEIGQRLYRTGDLARYLPDGAIEFLGRNDNQVKLRGFRIEIGEIEAALSRHPSVGEATVVVREDTPGKKSLVAYIVPKAGETCSGSELHDFLKELLPPYMLPAAFISLEKLPLTSSGKVDRQALPALTEERREAEDSFVAPRTQQEKILADIWAQVLGLTRVGVYDNFFELGGDSILGIQIVARAREQGLHLNSKHLFQYQTIAELATIENAVPGTKAATVQNADLIPLTPVQRWFFEQDLLDPHHFNQAVMLEVQPTVDPALLQRAIEEVLQWHDVFRLRFIHTETGWQQSYAPRAGYAFAHINFASLSEKEQIRSIEASAAELQTRLNPSEGPLAQIAFFDLGSQRASRLLIIIHHLIIDIISWQILLADLQRAYRQFERGEMVQASPGVLPFKQWAEHLREYAQSEALRRELPYWLSETRTQVAPLPVDIAQGPNTVEALGLASASLSKEETQALLQKVPQIYRTQISDILLAALACALADWTGQRLILLDLEGHGREPIFEERDFSRTIGWFTSLTSVLLDLRGSNSPEEVLKAVIEQLRALPNGGIGYGILRYLSEDTTITEHLRALPQAEISFNYQGRSAQRIADSSLFLPARESYGPSRSPRGLRRYLLDVNGAVISDQLRIDWLYSRNIHHPSTIERWLQTFLDILRSFIQQEVPIEETDTALPDLSLARLDQRKLQKALSTIKFQRNQEKFS